MFTLTSSVTSWEGGESIVDSSVGEPNRKRQQRDSWDDEYDRGKVSCFLLNDRKQETSPMLKNMQRGYNHSLS